MAASISPWVFDTIWPCGCVDGGLAVGPKFYRSVVCVHSSSHRQLKVGVETCSNTIGRCGLTAPVLAVRLPGFAFILAHLHSALRSGERILIRYDLLSGAGAIDFIEWASATGVPRQCWRKC